MIDQQIIDYFSIPNTAKSCLIKPDLEELEDQAAYLIQIRLEYSDKLSDCWYLSQQWKQTAKMKKSSAFLNAKNCSIDRAKNISEADPEYIQALNTYFWFEATRKKIQGFIETIDMKASTIPGMQGFRNRNLVEESEEFE